MWLWLCSWFFPDRRLIFTFWDGVRIRKADPLEVTRRLFDPAEEAKGFDIEETPQMLKCGVITQELEAFRLIGLAVRSAFDIPPVSQGGLTDMDCWVLLNSLCASNNGLKKNGSLFPTSSASTAVTSTPESPTSNGSGSGSIETVPSSAPPTLPAAGIS